VILTRQNHSTQRKTWPIVTLSTTKHIWTDLQLNLGICSNRLATKHLSHCTAKNFKFQANLFSILWELKLLFTHKKKNMKFIFPKCKEKKSLYGGKSITSPLPDLNTRCEWLTSSTD
jgi:hypothetical protein